MEKIELKVGETAEVHGKKVICKQFNGMPCNGCEFEPFKNGECASIACTDDERADEQFIILEATE